MKIRKKKPYYMPIIATLVCLGPYGNLLFDIATNSTYEKLLIPALLTFPTLIILCGYWTCYFLQKKRYKETDIDESGDS